MTKLNKSVSCCICNMKLPDHWYNGVPTPQCEGCWEVTHRLEEFLQNSKGISIVERALKIAKQKRNQ